MEVLKVLSILYVTLLVIVILRILFQTQSTSKSLNYILLCIFIPVLGMIFYMVFGTNYWSKRRYAKKMKENSVILQSLRQSVEAYDRVIMHAQDSSVEQNMELSTMLLKDLGSPLTGGNEVKILTNGEQKFPELLQAISEATHHIHLEYYMYEFDKTGMLLTEALVQKAKEGVLIRFIYDDFGSPSINREIENRMREVGIKIQAFYKIKFYLLANRFNYRNHRKIVVIDGKTAFVGGINVSDKYVNKEPPDKLYWRDTHLKITGHAVYYLQYLFISDWNFCSDDDKLEVEKNYFGTVDIPSHNCFVQITGGGPDSLLPTILYSMLQAINLAKEEIIITTPYFIPGDSMMDALCIAAMSGLKVKLLVPGVSDSKFVNAASRSNYSRLLQAGVEIYLYHKGFIHSKTMVTDSKLSIVGTANIDHRSFELNFEVNAIIYDSKIAIQMKELFRQDLSHAEKIDKEKWLNRKWYVQLPEKIARLCSPIL